MTEQFGCLLADPPWKFGDKLPGKGRGASKKYTCMSLEEIMRFELPPTTLDCWLFLWRCASMQEEALAVVRAWGFVVTSEIVWVKTTKKGRVRIGMGRTVRNSHEVCLVCRRGKPVVASHSVPSVVLAPRGEHSSKPECVQDAIEKLVGTVKKAELFARRHREGWSCFGNQLDNKDSVAGIVRSAYAAELARRLREKCAANSIQTKPSRRFQKTAQAAE